MTQAPRDDGAQEYYAEFADPDSGWMVIVADDGRVCYACLIDAGEEFRGDVWLYNRAATPPHAEWDNAEELPFLNPRDHVIGEGATFAPASLDGFSVRWSRDGDLVRADIFLRDRLFARLLDGAKPGWSVLAKQDGPLAWCFVECGQAHLVAMLRTASPRRAASIGVHRPLSPRWSGRWRA